MRTGALRGMILGRGHTASPQVPRESLYQDFPRDARLLESTRGQREARNPDTGSLSSSPLSLCGEREILVSKASDPDFSLYNRIHRAREG